MSTTQITPEEKSRREKTFAYAKASVELEGFRLTEEYEAAAQRYIAGEIEFSELTQFVQEQIKNG